MHKDLICCHEVSVCLSICHDTKLYHNGLIYHAFVLATYLFLSCVSATNYGLHSEISLFSDKLCNTCGWKHHTGFGAIAVLSFLAM